MAYVTHTDIVLIKGYDGFGAIDVLITPLSTDSCLQEAGPLISWYPDTFTLADCVICDYSCGYSIKHATYTIKDTLRVLETKGIIAGLTDTLLAQEGETKWNATSFIDELQVSDLPYPYQCIRNVLFIYDVGFAGNIPTNKLVTEGDPSAVDVIIVADDTGLKGIVSQVYLQSQLLAYLNPNRTSGGLAINLYPTWFR